MALVYWLCFCNLHNMAQLDDTTRTAISNAAELHLICTGGGSIEQLLERDSERFPKVILWCRDWNQYFAVLEQSLVSHARVAAITSIVVWEEVMLEEMNRRKGAWRCTTWIILKEVSVQVLSGGLPQYDVIGRVAGVYDMLLGVEPRSGIGQSSARQGISKKVPWAGLFGRKISIGCVALSYAVNYEYCFDLERNTVTHAFEIINATFDIVPVKRGKFADALNNREADIVVLSVGLTPDRYRHFDFVVNKFGRATFYIQKKWRHQAAFIFAMLPWTLVLALSVLLCACSFVLVNLRLGYSPTNGLGGATLALVAATLLLVSPLRAVYRRDINIRSVMTCWLLACFSLAAYTRSLLTASLTAQPIWEADDLAEEILPKLHAGSLLPCAETNSFFDVMLTSSLVHASGKGSDIVDAMASAVNRWHQGKRAYTGSYHTCLERTIRGTHVLLSMDIEPCTFVPVSHLIVEGKTPIRSLIGGFPFNTSVTSAKGRNAYCVRSPNLCVTCSGSQEVATAT
ncbi:hypothetical protein HPB49_014553 [Dermacentor silvarum]|uniref:Uncharacterized protein n=1 Tax=Dermacentor silvarum TaxID=543639 RepID=A0ACB8CS07_DERSI|nr:hypothetical protein HPB49_014553 [Dermacentor silvarum]